MWPTAFLDGGSLSHYRAAFEDEELTPALFRSMQPDNRRAALEELGVASADLSTVLRALSPETKQPLVAQQSAARRAIHPPAATSHSHLARVQPKRASLEAVYINLSSRSDRLHAMQSALVAAGIDAKRVEAILGDAVPDATACRLWDTTLNAKFDRNTTVRSDLAMSAGERGCAGSHALLWQRCMDMDDALLVLEDDVGFAGPKVGACVAALVRAIEEAFAPAERTMLLYLGADAYLREGAPSLRGQQASWAARGAATPCTIKEANWAWQTHAYVIWPAAARVLLAGLPIDAPVDVYLSRHFYERRLCGLVLEPQLAKQHDPYHGGDVEHSSLGDRPKLGSMAVGIRER